MQPIPNPLLRQVIPRARTVLNMAGHSIRCKQVRGHPEAGKPHPEVPEQM